MLVLRVADGLLFVAGRTLAGHRLLGESVIGDSKEIMVVLAILTCFALVAAGYVWRRELLEGEKTPHEKITKCIIILTSVVPRGLPMQMSLAVKAALMSLHSAGVFSTEPFRVPMAGKVTLSFHVCKTGTLTHWNWSQQAS